MLNKMAVQRVKAKEEFSKQIVPQQGPSNAFVIEGVQYCLPSSQKYLPPSMNSESVEGLLHGFFKFFSTFDFETQGISVSDGCAFTKTVDFSPLLIENPLGIGLNICKNVSLGQLQNLQSAMADAALSLEKHREMGGPGRSWLASLLSEHQCEENINVKIDSILSDFHDDEDNIVSNQDGNDLDLSDNSGRKTRDVQEHS